MDSSKLIEYLGQFVSSERKDKIEEVLSSRTRQLTIVLEDIFQEHNASAVLRSAECFGIQNIHLVQNKYKGFKAAHTITMGAHKWLSIHKYSQQGINNTEACFKSLRQNGYKIIAMHPHAKESGLKHVDVLNQKTALVIGSERDGLSDFALQNADSLVCFPMYGFSESFNLSVLTAMSINELRSEFDLSNKDLWGLNQAEQNELRLNWYKNSIRNIEVIESAFVKKHNLELNT